MSLFNALLLTEIYTLSLHDALPICRSRRCPHDSLSRGWIHRPQAAARDRASTCDDRRTNCTGRRGGHSALRDCCRGDRKSTRLNSSHVAISYAVFCLKKKKTILLNK